jgi:CBS domain-containing protein
MAEVVRDLLDRGIRSVPVVDGDRRVVGIVTNGDLVRRGGLPVRLELLRTFDTPGLHDALTRLAEVHREAREVMTWPVVTVHPGLDVQHAAQLMRRRKLKRLPVIDGDERIVGMVSRADLLRAAVAAPAREQGVAAPRIHVEATTPVRAVMSREVPTVGANESLSGVLDAVLSTRLNRAVVVDELSHVLGIITDVELLDCLTPEEHAGVLATLMHRVPFVHPSGTPHGGNHARNLMRTDIVLAHDGEPVRDVLQRMLEAGRKIVPIVDSENRLVGLVDRADLLGVLAEDV